MALFLFFRLLLDSLPDECCQKTAEAAQVRAELQKETSRTRQLEEDMQEAAALLRHTLTVRTQSGPGVRGRLL